MIAFEPNPILASRLRRLFADCNNVAVHDVALSNRTAASSLAVPYVGNMPLDGWAAIGRDFKGEKWRGNQITSQEHIDIHLATLDQYRLEGVGFIKIDVEGHEISVLEGGRETISKCRPILLVEIEQRHHPEQDIIDVIKCVLSLGYHAFCLLGGRLHPIAAPEPSPLEVRRVADRGVNNYIFLPQ